MPRQNRVTPMGELIVTPARGLVYGNRGCLHDDEGRIRRPFAVKRWIACRLRFKGWHREPLMQPGRFTELFFLDEATAMAAGHRPCALCRHEDYVGFAASWRRLHGPPVGADAIDTRLHAERLDRETRERRLHRAAFADLPEGAFVLVDGAPCLVHGGRLLRWSPEGYQEAVARPGRGVADVITPPSLVGILRSGWSPVVPLVHPSAARALLRPRRAAGS